MASQFYPLIQCQRKTVVFQLADFDLKQPTALQPGDSASLVVDALTSAAYGHVVARKDEDIYVVPFYNTIRQMKSFFQADDVRLPNAIELTDRVVMYNNRSESENEKERELEMEVGRERKEEYSETK